MKNFKNYFNLLITVLLFSNLLSGNDLAEKQSFQLSFSTEYLILNTGAPITDLIAINKEEGRYQSELDRLKGQGWTLVSGNFNKGIRGSNDIFILYRTDGSKPIRGLRAIITKNKNNRPDESRLVKNSHDGDSCDFNKRAGGKYIYLEIIKDGSQTPITALEVTEKPAGNILKDNYGDPADFNKNAGGADVFLKMIRE